MESLEAKSLSVRIEEDFLHAGSSAALIAISQHCPQFWAVALIALVPFLWRVTRTGVRESVGVGALLATTYGLVAMPGLLLVAPAKFFAGLAALNVLFALYGLVVNRVARHVGFNIVFVAALWVPIEYLLGRLGPVGSLFTLTETDSGVFLRLGSLFGILIVSFAVVLINSLILIVSERLLRSSRPNHVRVIGREEQIGFLGEKAQPQCSASEK